MRVLLADDDRITTTLMTSVLVRQGWHVQSVSDAMQALMYATRTPAPDVIVLDLNMPGGTGFHTLKRLSASSRTSHIPVVILTGSLDPAAEATAHELGAARFLRKPVEPQHLAEVLAEVCASPV
jgi:CheY-like chemotaxis protein